MTKENARRLVKETFENPFDRDKFVKLILELLNEIDETNARANFGDRIPEAFQEFITRIERVGKYTNDKHQIMIFIVYLKKETSIDRARTMQRNFIAWYLKHGTDPKDAALVAFVSPDTNDWRFSLVKMDYKFDEKGKVKEDVTPARRWSFLVGGHEKSHTAQSRLAPLIENDEENPSLADLEEAFNIEKVTKEFFSEYRKLFIDIKEALDLQVTTNEKIRADFEKHGVNTVDFAKKLLGQIVFLYFLQKKGWFGVKLDEVWGTGSKSFLRELFGRRHGSYDNFFNDILEPLFYEALRNDRSHDDHYYSRFKCKIPFLNGGLFDPINNYRWAETDILLPDELFSNEKETKTGDKGDGILDVFDRYNFTVREDEPLEKEVAIDPELLGKAYEKFNAIRPDNFEDYKKALKSGKKGEESKFNRQFGVYYTPREIVHYMCQQSLINYLATEIGEKSNKKDVETFFNYSEHVMENEEHVKNAGKETDTYRNKIPESIRKNAEKIDTKLAEIKVCDPAVGSGAFPVGMMSEIIKVRKALNAYIKDQGRTVYYFKRECIENSLYGVDIDPGAVEIAKLRLWLSLVVDEDDIKQIKPLPNLDYKIVCGNSLLGVEKNLFNSGLFEELEKIKLLYFNETNPTRKQKFKTQINVLISQITNGHSEFDFEVYFSEVFHDKSGFDIVIANPPYVGQKGNKNLFSIMSKDPNFEKKMDYWYFFLHKAYDISKNNGFTSFITPNYWVTANGAKKLRQKIISGYYFVELINFNDNNVFEAGIHTNLFILKKSLKKNNCIRCTVFNTQYNDDLIGHKNDESNFIVDQKYLLQKWTGFIHFLPNYISNIINKLVLDCEKLSDNESIGKSKLGVIPGKKVTDGICNINQGIITGKDRYKLKENNIDHGVYILNLAETQQLNLTAHERKFVKPFVKNSNIHHYFIDKNIYHNILYIDEIESEKDFSELTKINTHLQKYKTILKDRFINGVLESAYKKGKWWALIHSVPIKIIKNPKIVCPQRSKQNLFAYSESEIYASADVYYISLNNENYSLKYILALLNSKLIYFWLYWMGEKKGELLELYFEPLQFIPIKTISEKDQKPFISIVDRILTVTQSVDYLQNQTKQDRIMEYEKEIDQLVYELYGLTMGEIKIVEGDK